MKHINEEFNFQYLKVGTDDCKISLSDNKKIYYDIEMDENGVINQRPFIETAFQSVYLIDNPLIVDKWKDKNNKLNNSFIQRNLFRGNFIPDGNEVNFYIDHYQKLVNLINENSISSFEEIQNSEIYDKIFDSITQLMPSDIYIEDNEYVYSQGKIKLQNLATGLKIFIILKTLVEKNKADRNSLLIFDEPESHLHPEWQNVFAETIAKLIKYNKCRIVLATHSPQFLLALETAAIKLEIKDKTNFYHIKNIENAIIIEEINNNVNKAYAEMVKPFLQMEALNTQYKYGDGNKKNEYKK